MALAGDKVTVVVQLAPDNEGSPTTIVDHAFVQEVYPDSFEVRKARGPGRIVVANYDEDITWTHGWHRLRGRVALALLAAHALKEP